MPMKVFSTGFRPFVDVEFDRDLPMFPEPNRARYRSYDGHIFSRTQSVNEYAKDMAARNAGCTPVEMHGEPCQTYREFLNDLLIIPGFVGIVAASRYLVRIEAGRYFNVSKIASLVADVVRRHFYSEAGIQFQIVEALEDTT
jgi:hypothetical protein